MKKNKYLLAPLILSFSLSASAFDEDYKSKLNEYNQQYSELLLEKSQWPEKIAKVKGDVVVSQENYDQALENVSGYRLILDRANRDLENQVAHLEYLKQVEPVSIETQKQIQRAAVNAGEFAATTDVNTLSLQNKADSLQGEIDLLKKAISDKWQEISDIESSFPYKSLLDAKAQLEIEKSGQAQLLSTVQGLISSYNANIELMTQSLAESNTRESEAAAEAIRIRTAKIPAINLQIKRLNDEIDILEADLPEKRKRRKRINKRIGELEQEIKDTEALLDQDGADINAINAKLDQLRTQLGNKKIKWAEVDTEIKSDRGTIQVKTALVAELEQDVDDLEELALAKDAQVGEEQILQLGLSEDISEAKGNLGEQELEEIRLNGVIAGLNTQIGQAQDDIDAYRKEHIAPIKVKIDGLEGTKGKIARRKSKLLAWKKQIQVQDANIAESNDRIKTQLKVVDTATLTQKSAHDSFTTNNQSVVDTKVELNTSIRTYNSVATEINQKISEFQRIEKETLDLKNSLLEKEVEDVE